MDRPLYSGGVVNRQATLHRDELAQGLYDGARRALLDEEVPLSIGPGATA